MVRLLLLISAFATTAVLAEAGALRSLRSSERSLLTRRLSASGSRKSAEGACDHGKAVEGQKSSSCFCAGFSDSRKGYKGKKADCVFVTGETVCFPRKWAEKNYKNKFTDKCVATTTTTTTTRKPTTTTTTTQKPTTTTTTAAAPIKRVSAEGACDHGTKVEGKESSCKFCAGFFDSRGGYDGDKGHCVFVEGENRCFPKSWAERKYAGKWTDKVTDAKCGAASASTSASASASSSSSADAAASASGSSSADAAAPAPPCTPPTCFKNTGAGTGKSVGTCSSEADCSKKCKDTPSCKASVWDGTAGKLLDAAGLKPGQTGSVFRKK